MLLVICYLLFVTCYLLFVTCNLLLVTSYLLLVFSDFLRIAIFRSCSASRNFSSVFMSSLLLYVKLTTFRVKYEISRVKPWNHELLYSIILKLKTLFLKPRSSSNQGRHQWLPGCLFVNPCWLAVDLFWYIIWLIDLRAGISNLVSGIY